MGLLALLSGGARNFQQELSRRLGVAPSLLVAMADDLEHLGAISRVRDPDDRRKSTLEVTALGLDLLDRCTQALQEADDELLSQLGEVERQALERILGALFGSLAEQDLGVAEHP